jgi:uncharacterized membrane protein
MTTPNWALSIAYWFHMLATVTWIGGLAVLSLLVLPAARKTLDKRGYANLLDVIRRRLDSMGWLSIMVLLASGMLQLSASPHYEGFLAINGLWAGAILAKHILFGVMVAISGYVTWGIMPKMRRAALLQARGKDAGEMDAIQGRSLRLMRFNLILGIVVLLLTAVARSS